MMQPFHLKFLILLFTAAPAFSIEYTLQQTADHTLSIINSPWVQPTVSAAAYDAGQDGTADAGLDAFIIGRTPGTAGGGYTWDPGNGTPMNVPGQDIYGYRITDTSVTGPKEKIVILSGNHADESHALYALQAFVDFLLSNDPKAVELRQLTEVYVYPMVNPEGRWAPNAGKLSGVAFQPEHPNYDHNRFWDDPDTPIGRWNRPWSSIQIVRSAIIADTQQQDVRYFFDVHSPGPTQTRTFIYTGNPNANLTVFGQTVLNTSDFTHFETGTTASGTSRSWSTSAPAQGGLGATFGMAPEIGRQPNDTLSRYYDLGEALILGVYAELTAEEVVGNLKEVLVDFNGAAENPLPSTEWNVVPDRGSSIALLNTDGTQSAVALGITGASNSTASDHWDDAKAGPDWLDTAENAARDYFYGYAGESDHLNVTINGLEDGEYSLELIASSYSTWGTRTATYRVNGQFFDGSSDGRWNHFSDGYEDGGWMSWSSVTPIDGRITLNIFHTNSDDRSRINALRLKRIFPADSYEEWITGYPIEQDDIGISDDPDEDGIANALENVFGTNPTVSDDDGGTINPKAVSIGTGFQFTHPLNASPAVNLVLGYQWSTDLATFHDSGVSVDGVTVTFSSQADTPEVGTTTVTANLTEGVPQKLFVRAIVNIVNP